MHSLFFYGTLMHPAVLERVIGRPGAHLTTVDAILNEHTRHHVKNEDYPAVVPKSSGKAVLGRELSGSEATVRGSLVEGLTDEDVAFLDEFEGDEYARSSVTVLPIATTPINSEKSSESNLLSPESNPVLSTVSVPAEVYIWISSLSRLSPSLWTYNEFLRDSAHRWVGDGGKENGYYVEVDRRREMKGNITPREQNGNGVKELVKFGKECREKYWDFEKDWININHGSFGAPPKPVIKSMRALQKKCSQAPDLFMRFTYIPMLTALRGRLADMVGCAAEDLVIVNNASAAVYVVLSSLSTTWQKGDKILHFPSTIYNACGESIQWVIDSHPELELEAVGVPLEYPISHSALVERTRKTIEEEEKKGKGGRIRLALFDSISSNPGVVVPWEDLVKLFKKHDILSLVDGAHEIGQQPVNLAKSRPDFWLSNCHKWLMAHRGVAVLYVSKEHQYKVHSVPIGHSYKHHTISSPTKGTPNWITEFEWNGTIDYSPVLSVEAALDFRRDVLGGEARIIDYCHKLAVEGGEKVAVLLGTEVLNNTDPEKDGELVASMTNVRLPIPFPDDSLPASEQTEMISKQIEYIHKTAVESYQTFCPVYVHAKKFYTRLSAQVYLDLSDFERVGEILVEICRNCRAGEYLSQ